METSLVSLISMALIVVSVVTMTVSMFQSSSKLADSWNEMERQSSCIARTSINASAPDNYQGGLIDLTIENSGQVNLNGFSGWDFIFQFQSGNSRYLAYTASYPPGDNQWSVRGIYMPDGLPEKFDPTILNPGENIIVSVALNPGIGKGETAKVTVSTPIGVTSQCYVTNRLP
jgi:hypothetical protein